MNSSVYNFIISVSNFAFIVLCICTWEGISNQEADPLAFLSKPGQFQQSPLEKKVFLKRTEQQSFE